MLQSSAMIVPTMWIIISIIIFWIQNIMLKLWTWFLILFLFFIILNHPHPLLPPLLHPLNEMIMQQQVSINYYSWMQNWGKFWDTLIITIIITMRMQIIWREKEIIQNLILEITNIIAKSWLKIRFIIVSFIRLIYCIFLSFLYFQDCWITCSVLCIHLISFYFRELILILLRYFIWFFYIKYISTNNIYSL